MVQLPPPQPTPHHSGFTHPNGSRHRHCACRIHGSHLGKATLFAPSEEFLRPPNHPLSLFAPLRGQIRGLRTLSQLGVRAWWDHCLGSACTPDYQGSAGLVCFQLWPQGGVQAIQTLAPSPSAGDVTMHRQILMINTTTNKTINKN